MLVAIDIGGTKITVSIVNQEKILIKIFQNVRLKGTNMTIIKQIDEMIAYACQKINITEKEIIAIGISTCSPFVLKNNHKVIVAPNLCGGLGRQQTEIPNNWTEIPLQQHLSQKYPTVKMENDCVSAVVAEKMFGAGKEISNVIYVTWSTGVGCGAYVNGQLLKGKNGNAPHLGPIYMRDSNPESGNKNFTYLEALSSGTAIARNYGNNATTKEIFQLYHENLRAKEIVDNAIYHFTQGLISINYILDTEIIILGGSVFFHNEKLLMPKIKKIFNDASFSVFSDNVQIVSSKLKENLGDMAALSLVMPDEWLQKWEKTTPWLQTPSVFYLNDN